MADEKEHKDEKKEGKGVLHSLNQKLGAHDEIVEKVAGNIISRFANPIAVRIFNKWVRLEDEFFGGVATELISDLGLLASAVFLKGTPLRELSGLALQRVTEEIREEFKRRVGKSPADATRDAVAGTNVSGVHATPKGLADDLTQAGRILMAMSAVADPVRRGEFWGWYETLDEKQWDKFNRAIAGIADEKLIDLANNDHDELDAFMQAIPDNPEPPKVWDNLFEVFKDVHADAQLMAWVRAYLIYVNDLYEPAFAENRDAFWNAALSEAKTIVTFREIMSMMTPTTLNPSGWTDAINKFLKVQYRTSEVAPPPKFSLDRMLEEEGVDLDAQVTASEDGLARARAARDAARERLGGN